MIQATGKTTVTTITMDTTGLATTMTTETSGTNMGTIMEKVKIDTGTTIGTDSIKSTVMRNGISTIEE